MGGTRCQSPLSLGWQEVFGYGTIAHCLPCAASEKYGAVSAYSYACGGWAPSVGGFGGRRPGSGRKKAGGVRPPRGTKTGTGQWGTLPMTATAPPQQEASTP